MILVKKQWRIGDSPRQGPTAFASATIFPALFWHQNTPLYGQTVTKDFLAAQMTPWTLILSAQKGDASPLVRRECLDRLFRQYHLTIIRFFRQLGFANYADRNDLAQEYFLRFIEKDLLEHVDPGKGCFRAYLKAIARRFAYDVRFREKGRHSLTGVSSLSSSGGGADEGMDLDEYPDDNQAEDIFDRQWARSTLETALANFRRDCAERGLEHWATVFERHTLPVPHHANRSTVAESAEFLNLTPKQVENHITRANACFRDHLRKVVRMTVASDAEVEEEMMALRRVLSGNGGG